VSGRGAGRSGISRARPRRIIASLATSADGFIARGDGSVDWLDRPRPRGNYEMAAFLRTIDTILLGRKTWDQALAMGVKKGGFGAPHYVFSRQPPAEDANGVTYVRERLEDFVRRLRAEPGRDVWVMGGAGLIGSVLDAGELDELIIHVVPVLIGEGIPLLPAGRRKLPLRLASLRKFSDGVVRLHYALRRDARRRLPRRA
jgi:dihydrofolate reductase